MRKKNLELLVDKLGDELFGPDFWSHEKGRPGHRMLPSRLVCGTNDPRSINEAFANMNAKLDALAEHMGLEFYKPKPEDVPEVALREKEKSNKSA